MRRLLVTAGFVFGLADVSVALDAVINVDRIVLRRKPGAGDRAVVKSGSAGIVLPAPDGPDDPRAVGALVEFISDSEGVASLVAPAEGWRRSPSDPGAVGGYWKFTAVAGSPIRKLAMGGARSTVRFKSTMVGLPMAQPQGGVSVRITMGSQRYCSRFSGPSEIHVDVPGRFVGVDSGATGLADCSDVSLGIGTTTTTTSTTSTTLMPCGGGPFSCGGACDPGLMCAPVSDFEPYCGCIPDGTQPCESQSNPYCNGTCGDGGTCGPSGAFPFAACICIPPGGTPCGLASAPVCGGVCPSGQECQSYDLDTLLFCACAVAGSPCGCAMPGTCPGDESCHVDFPCGCAP